MRGSTHLEEFFRNLGEGGGSRWSWSFGSWSDWCMVHMGLWLRQNIQLSQPNCFSPYFRMEIYSSVHLRLIKICCIYYWKVLFKSVLGAKDHSKLSIVIIHMTFRSGFVKWKIKISVKRTDQSWMETQYVCHT